MAIRTQRWRPDTCGCSLLFDWDDTIKNGNNIVGNHVAEKKCVQHAHLDGAAHYHAVLAHNRAENQKANRRDN